MEGFYVAGAAVGGLVRHGVHVCGGGSCVLGPLCMPLHAGDLGGALLVATAGGVQRGHAFTGAELGEGGANLAAAGLVSGQGLGRNGGGGGRGGGWRPRGWRSRPCTAYQGWSGGRRRARRKAAR